MRNGWYRVITVILAVGGASALFSESQVKQANDQLDNIVETVVFHETPISDVLRLLATQNHLNLIIGPDSMGPVSLRFHGVTLRAALDAILRVKGYQYQVHDNILVVTTPDSLEKLRGLGLETEIFKLKYASAEDVKMAIDTAKVLSPWGYTTIFNQSIKTDANIAAGIISGELQDAGQRIATRSDILIITDRPNNIEIVRSFIDKLDLRVRQLLIDVHFVETILEDKTQLGIDWNAVLSAEGKYHGKTDWIMGGESGLTGAEGGALQLGSLANTQFRAILDLMLSNQNANLLSQPRITTLDNQPANIFVGFTTWIEERSGTEATGVQITYTERQVPIELIVVPHIIHNDQILLELQPTVEEITGWQEGAHGQQLPIISTRSADSRIEVKNGETAIIGGLIKEKTIQNTKKVWLLSSIPLIGHLFRYKVEEKERSDLTIFITTYILQPGKPLPSPEIDMEKHRAHSTETEPEWDQEPIKEEVLDQPEVPDTGEYTPPPATEKTTRKAKAPEKTDEKPTVSAPVQAKKPSDQVHAGNILQMRQYFPIESIAKWKYLWRQSDGSRWESLMEISGNGGLYEEMHQSVLSGPHVSKTRTGYRWSEQGLENIYKQNVGGDSTSYSPPRIILPSAMIENETCRSVYNWTKYSANGRLQGRGRVIQIQRLIGKHHVTTKVGRFRDCVAIETIWYDPDHPVSSRMRKVVWYASRVGPVKVENNIALEAPSLKGKLSALLIER